MRVIGRLEEPTVHRLLNTLLIMVCLLVMLACGGGLRRPYGASVRGMPDGHQHCSVSADRVQRLGTVPLSAEAVEERLRDQLERGELTMEKIRADYAHYCE